MKWICKKCKPVEVKGKNFVINSCAHHVLYRGKFGVFIIDVYDNAIVMLASEKKGR